MKVRMTLRLLQDSSGKGIAAFTLDEASKALAKEAGWKLGESYDFDTADARTHARMKYAHKVGQLVRDNMAGFEHLDPHDILKRLQAESGVHCHVVKTYSPAMGRQINYIPKSLSYKEVPKDSDFAVIIRSLCEYISVEYWPDMQAEEIENMAGLQAP